MLKTCAEIAKIKNCTRQAANDFLKKNKISPSGKKGKYPSYDVGKKPLASYLAAKDKDRAPAGSKRAGMREIPRPSPPKNAAAVRRISKPLNDLVAGITPPGQKPAAFFYDEALKIAKKNQDAALYFKLGQIAAKEDADEQLRSQALKTEQAKEQIAQEKAERLKIENDIRKEMYMEIEKVKILFGRVYAAHTSILTPLSLKLSSMLAAVPQGNKKEATIKKLIDDEIFAALESIQRTLVGFIKE